MQIKGHSEAIDKRKEDSGNANMRKPIKKRSEAIGMSSEAVGRRSEAI